MRCRVATLFHMNTSGPHLNEKESRISKDFLACTLPLSTRYISFPHHNFGSDEKSLKVNHNHNHKWVSPLSLHLKNSPAISSLDVEIESPPLVFYGPTTTSSGALLSGQLILKNLYEAKIIDSFEMSLELGVTRKRPFHTHCAECSKQRIILERWKFLHGPAIFFKGQHKFPFSGILPGHLPASTKGALFQIEYSLHATLYLRDSAEPIILHKVLDVKRAIIASDVPRSSIRIFPPTNLSAHCELPSVIHPMGASTVSIRIDGCVKKSGNTQHHWKLKRLHWHLEETQKTISPGCPKHLAKRLVHDEQSKSILHSDSRVIGEGYFRMGWKTDYSTDSGRIDMEFPVEINPGARPLCDLKTRDGTEVSHSLIIEMIVVEALTSKCKPSQDVLTGVARFLRMHFDIIVTERSGLGISWDEEQPPLYENVPTSPPEYANIVSCRGEPLPDYQSIIRIDAVRVGRRPSNGVEHLPSHLRPLLPEHVRKIVSHD